MSRVLEIREGRRIVFAAKDPDAQEEDIVIAEVVEVDEEHAGLMPLQSVYREDGEPQDVDWIGYAIQFYYTGMLPGDRVYGVLSSYVIQPSTGLLRSASFRTSKIEDGDIILMVLRAGRHPTKIGDPLLVCITYFLREGLLEPGTFIADSREVIH